MKEPILYKIVRPIITFLFKLFMHPHIIGKENIPKEGSVVLAGNHTNILDPLLIMSCTKRTVHFLAKEELVKGKFAFIFKHMGIIPVNRKEKGNIAFENAVKYLNNNKVIGIFPEATINKTKDITIPFKTGAVRMAHITGSKIVPFSITGKYHLFSHLTIVFKKPYSIGNDKDSETKKLKTIIEKMILERR